MGNGHFIQGGGAQGGKLDNHCAATIRNNPSELEVSMQAIRPENEQLFLFRLLRANSVISPLEPLFRRGSPREP